MLCWYRFFILGDSRVSSSVVGCRGALSMYGVGFPLQSSILKCSRSVEMYDVWLIVTVPVFPCVMLQPRYCVGVPRRLVLYLLASVAYSLSMSCCWDATARKSSVLMATSMNSVAVLFLKKRHGSCSLCLYPCFHRKFCVAVR